MFRNLSFRKFRFPQDKWCIICSLFSTGLWLEMQARHTQDPLCHPTFHLILDVYSSHSLFCLWLPRPVCVVWCGLFGMIRLANEIVKLGSTDLDWPVGQSSFAARECVRHQWWTWQQQRKEGLYLTNVHTFLTVKYHHVSNLQICWSGTPLCQGCVFSFKN